jgi:hypothetical protein
VAKYPSTQTPSAAWTNQESGADYKYYVTSFGKEVLTAGLKLRELVIIPQLAYGRIA